MRTTHSVISIGTERMKVEQAKMNLLEKAYERVRIRFGKYSIQRGRSVGGARLKNARNRLETPTPLGYSAAGIVAAVDAGNTRFRVGDRVACAGTECAYHAEYLGVPDMLAARVPDAVENWQAAYTTIAAIGMHAVRQAEPSWANEFW